MNNNKNEHIRIRITTEQLVRLCMLIKEENTTKSQFLREAIEEKLNRFSRRKHYIEKSSLLNDYNDYLQASKKNKQ
jgi:predicted DNA-binding protein